MSRLSEVTTRQTEREKEISQCTTEATMRDICSALERITGHLEEISVSLAMLVDIKNEKKKK